MADETANKQEFPVVGTIPIVRDPGFVRLYADAFIPYRLTDGIELTLLVASPDLSNQSFDIVNVSSDKQALSSSGIKPTPTYAEVARLRLDDEAIENMLSIVIGAMKTRSGSTDDRIRRIVEDTLNDNDETQE